ncbi:MAG: hypothetical protein H8E64_05800 [Candidatus Marinimicrobia bacterium]|nr:hypothetical protein [Candidatus Neomarinimicrobiota bacterium]
MINLPIKLLLIVGLLLSACTRVQDVIQEPPPVILEYDALKLSYQTCSGSGKITSSGTVKGHLVFSFTSRNDSTYIQFKDLLGRRTMYIQLFENEIHLWDMMKNRRYSEEKIIEQFPVVSLISPLELTKYFWGVDPFESTTDVIPVAESKSLNATLHSKSSVTSNGFETISLLFQDHQEDYELSLEITDREYGSWSSRFVRSIPSSVKWN